MSTEYIRYPSTVLPTSEITLHFKKVTLTPSQIQSLVTPISLVDDPGVGKFVVLRECDAYMTYAGTAYATQNTYNIKQSTNTVTGNTGMLFATSTQFRQLGIATQIPLFENAGFKISCASNPTLGNSSITFYITWQEITL